jgi:hypothetical protein
MLNYIWRTLIQKEIKGYILMKNQYILTTLFLFIILFSRAQNFAWAKSSGGSSFETALSIAVDTSGNTYTVGYYRSASITFGSFTLTSPGTAGHMYIVKSNSVGTVLWAKAATGNDQNEADAVAVDPFGNVLVTGTYQNTMTVDGFTLNSSGGAGDMFLAKYNSNGNVIWIKSSGGTNTEFPKSITSDASGNIFVAGEFSSSPMIIGTYALNNAGLFDMFVTKFDPLGNPLWASRAGTAMEEGATTITADALGNTYVGGYFENSTIVFGTDTLRNSASPNEGMFLVKYNATGTIQWAKSPVGGCHIQSASASGGDIYITGSFFDSVTFETTTILSAGNYDIFIAKYDSDGNLIWVKKEGGSNVDVSYSIASDAMSNIYITGFFTEPSVTFGGKIITNAGGHDIFLVKYDTNGDPLWSISAGGNLDDAANSVACNATDVFIAGEFNSPVMDVGSFTLNNVGNTDVFIAKLSPTITGITSTDNPSCLAIFPNPSSGIFTIQADQFTDAAICIYDVFGNCVYRTVCIKKLNQLIDLSGQAKGVYFIEVSAGDKKEVKKFAVD